MKPKDIKVLFWDDPINFNRPETKRHLGINVEKDNESELYKDVLLFNDQTSYKKALDSIEAKDNVIVLCHISFSEEYKGFVDFNTFRENNSIANECIYFVSSNKEAHESFIKSQATKIVIYTYSEVSTNIKSGVIKPYKKGQIIEENDSKTNILETFNNEDIKYAVFTALYDEFKELEDIFKWDNEEKTGSAIFKKGTLKGTDKRVVATYASKSGMVEASILVTEMIHRYNPEYVLMPGVCGGEEKTQFGSVIIASKVFLLGKGKVTDLKDNEGKKIDLNYNEQPFNPQLFTDGIGNQVEIIVEKNLLDNETIDLDTQLHLTIEPNLESIISKINKSNPYITKEKEIKYHFEPMACSLKVIDKEDYFEVNIKTIDRKTKAVEMESYGVARACKIANGGKTKFLIFKSVMDKASQKGDDYKKIAAYTSAQFLKYLLEDNII